MSKSSLQCFDFNTHQVRVIIFDGQPWFVAQDVLDAISSKTTVTSARNAVEKELGEEFVNCQPLETLGGTQQVFIFAEAAITFLLSRSRTEMGRSFNKLLHSTILPAIRKTGRYEIEPTVTSSLPMTYIDALKALVAAEEEKAQFKEANVQLAVALYNEREKAEVASAAVALLTPKAESYDIYVNSDGWLNGEQIAKQMAIPKLSVRKLYDILREEKVIFKRAGDGINIPCQKWVDLGLAKLRDIRCPDDVMRRGLVFHRKAFDRILDILRDRGLVPAGRDYSIVVESNVVQLKRAEA